MANRRMLSKSISYSMQVHSLSNDFVKLVFTWGIPHLDDFGKIDGEAAVFMAIVMPMDKKTPIENVESAIQELVKKGLIERYTANGKSVIRYLNFERYQTGLNKRTRSRYPNKDGSYEDISDNFSENQRNSSPSEENKTEKKSTERNLTKANSKEKIANKDFQKVIDPDKYEPKDDDETAAHLAWKKLEPNNKASFFTTYLMAVRRGLKADTIYRFVSEVTQDNSIKNPGKVFNAKVKEWCKIHEDYTS